MSTREWQSMFFAALNHLKRAILFVFGTLLLCGAGFTFAGGSMIWGATRQWPRVEGRVTHFDTRPSTSSPAKDQLALRYEYSIGDRKLVGEAFSPLVTDGEVSRSTAAWIEREFPINAAVDVIYDPANPSRSFLEMPGLFLGDMQKANRNV